MDILNISIYCIWNRFLNLCNYIYYTFIYYCYFDKINNATFQKNQLHEFKFMLFK